jgi:hypothetical protein
MAEAYPSSSFSTWRTNETGAEYPSTRAKPKVQSEPWSQQTKIAVGVCVTVILLVVGGVIAVGVIYLPKLLNLSNEDDNGDNDGDNGDPNNPNPIPTDSQSAI